MQSRLCLILTVAVLVAGGGFAADRPVISPNGIINGASDRSVAPAAPGSLISIYGSNLAPAIAAGTADTSGRLPLLLSGTFVTIDGRRAPLLFVSPGQINAQVPFEAATGNRDVVVNAGGVASNPVRVQVSTAAPAVFPGAILRNFDFSIVTSANPARIGEVLLLYCTGLGPVNPAVPSGSTAPATPLSMPLNDVSVTTSGKNARVYYAALSPGFVGLYQVAFVVPESIDAGKVTITVSQLGIVSNSIAIDVQKSSGRYAWQLFHVASMTATTVAVADLNGDGLPDIVSSSGAGTISILQSDGKGGFAPEVKIAAGFSVLQVLVFDVNGDGRPDLVYRRYSDTTSVYVASARPQGGFVDAASWSSGLAISEMRAADINGDGVIDLVLSHGDSGQVSVALGNGTGGFGSPVRTPSRFPVRFSPRISMETASRMC